MGTKMAVAVVSAALLSALAVRVSAHHGFAAEFDATSTITLKGVITKIERLNPHGWIYVDVKGQDGQVKNWAVETVGPATLARRGVRKDSLPIGVEVVVTGYRAKDGSNIANGNQIKLPDGRDLFLGSTDTGAPTDNNRPPY